MTLSRRELLRRAGLLGAATLIPTFSACTKDPGSDDEDGTGTGETDSGDLDTGTDTGGDGLPVYEWEGDPGPEDMFADGVASGDPLADAIILWTRVRPASVDESVELFFEMAIDPDFEMRVAADYISQLTTADRDHTMKIDVADLDADTTYYYRFYAQGRTSPIGRTRTAPDGPSDRLRFAVTSCASYAHGHYHAYDEISGRADLSAVFHLGDYIYEFGDGVYGDVRTYDPPHETVTLDDYRRRYRHQRADPGLYEIHRQHPFIVTWDDHEVANDAWTDGAENHSDDEGDWFERKAAGVQAFFEWLPIREGEPGRVYRRLSYGDLVDIIVLDTRYEGRDEQIALTDMGALESINDPDRQLLGEAQESWCFDRLSESTAQWKLLAQQVMVGHMILTPGEDGEPHRPFFADPWDGYEHARRRLLNHISDNDIADVVVLTGDVHSSFVNDCTIDPLLGYDSATGDGSVCVEFVTPGITSPGLSFDDGTLSLILSRNPHMQWVEVLKKGYLVIDVDADRLQGDYFHFTAAQVGSPNFTGSEYASSWMVESGVPHAVEAAGPAPEIADAAPLAP